MHSRGAALQPVAQLTTDREVRRFGVDGTSLVEISLDRAQLRPVVNAPESASEEPVAGTSWLELQVRIEGDDELLRKRVDRQLRRLGARRVTVGSGGRGASKSTKAAKKPVRERFSPMSPSADVIVAYLAQERDRLIAEDIPVRLDRPDALHQMRVATRRLRGALRTFAALFTADVIEPVEAELKWLAGELGAARDAEVLRARLVDAVTLEQAHHLATSAVTRSVDRETRRGQREALAAVIAALDSDRYRALITALDAIVSAPPTTKKAQRSARKQLRRPVADAYSRVHKALAHADKQPAGSRARGPATRGSQGGQARAVRRRGGDPRLRQGGQGLRRGDGAPAGRAGRTSRPGRDPGAAARAGAGRDAGGRLRARPTARAAGRAASRCRVRAHSSGHRRGEEVASRLAHLSGVDALERGPLAPPERTLVDILDATAAAFPDEPAIDDGHAVVTYAELLTRIQEVARRLDAAGVGRGDRVGIRMPSGSADLYVAVLGTLAAGAAYVPVDADDPRERANLVFQTARVSAVLTGDLDLRRTGLSPNPPVSRGVVGPSVDDDAWIIFTSGSTGTPKGVAVTHRSAAAFVDAEARLFLQERPLGPGDRVLAGLSVAFDASCEEMWLAWRHGGCLVPAPRALVRSGMDLAPWLVDREISVVSTVPTLASLWPPASLDAVRLLIFGGEACPPELVDRLAVGEREVWNTYGPTEATVVACGARVTPGETVRIGLPLDGWDLAVVDRDGQRVGPGDVGELIIGGVGLARYLDETLNQQRFAPMTSLGWERAYRSGDLVRADPEGLVFLGRADDQVKVGGRRIELGEIDAALLGLDGVGAAATAVRTTAAGNRILVGYVAWRARARARSRGAAIAALRDIASRSLVPLLAPVDDIPTRTRARSTATPCPWPLAVGRRPRTTRPRPTCPGRPRGSRGLWARGPRHRRGRTEGRLLRRGRRQPRRRAAGLGPA